MNYTGKKVLVTGGAGFIGSNLVRALLREGAYVTVMDDFSTGNKENLFYHEGMQLYEMTVYHPNHVKHIVQQADFDIIFHLAARNIIASTKNPKLDYDTNIGGTLNLLMAAKEFGVARFIYTSSASVYGNPKYLPINEDDGINLLTPYAVSKYAGEGYCLAFHESYGVPVTILRLSNVYGPWQSPSNPYCGVVAKFMEKVRHGEAVEIHGDGLSTRDFTYVEDVVDALLLAGESERAIGEVFNVATGIETSINGLYGFVVEGVANATEDYDYSFLDPGYVDRRDIDNIRRRVLNIEKIRRKLGWMPKHTLYDGMKKTAEWMRDYANR